MPVYSHSRLETFEQCPQKYKFKYIDKIQIIEKPIEAFLGTRVHETLEWLYSQVKLGKIPSVDETVNFYITSWYENYQDDIYIVKKHLTQKDYFNMGISLIFNYYTKYHPFNDNTLETEKKIYLRLEENKWLIGFIDRLVHNPLTDEIEIHDYKTSNSLPSKEKIDSDRQLALYGLAIGQLEKFQGKKIKLIWHYLSFNEKIISERNKEQLEQLKKQTLELINKIESEKEFLTKKSVLCDWCQFKKICPAWN